MRDEYGSDNERAKPSMTAKEFGSPFQNIFTVAAWPSRKLIVFCALLKRAFDPEGIGGVYAKTTG